MPDQYPPTVDPATGLPQSPTGTPRIPATWIPYVNLVMGLASLAGIVLAAVPAIPPWPVALCGGIFTVGLWLLGNGPGLRRLVVLVAAVGAVTSLSGCAWWKANPKLQTDLASCASTTLEAEVASLMPAVLDAIAQHPVDWQPKLDELKPRGLGALACAVAAVIDALMSGQGGSETDPLAQYDQAQRAAYLRLYLRDMQREAAQ